MKKLQPMVDDIIRTLDDSIRNAMREVDVSVSEKQVVLPAKTTFMAGFLKKRLETLTEAFSEPIGKKVEIAVVDLQAQPNARSEFMDIKLLNVDESDIEVVDNL